MGVLSNVASGAKKFREQKELQAFLTYVVFVTLFSIGESQSCRHASLRMASSAPLTCSPLPPSLSHGAVTFDSKPGTIQFELNEMHKGKHAHLGYSLPLARPLPSPCPHPPQPTWSPRTAPWTVPTGCTSG